MDVNDRRRRAAQRLGDAVRRRQAPAHRPAVGETAHLRAPDPSYAAGRAEPRAEDQVAEQARIAGLVADVVARIDGTRRDDGRLATYADMLVHRAAPGEPDAVLGALEVLLRSQLGRVRRGGWPEADLAPLVERTLGPAHLPTLEQTLRRRPLRHLASGLGLAALLASAPLLDARALVGPRTGAVEHPRLARVRALLAKAESTDHPAEAELLSAKAQELVARHALEDLLDDPAGPAHRPQVRRLWLDAPYVDAKATLVSAVASANRCRSAAAVHLGYAVVVGDARDLDRVELLSTSLLAQAGSAMAHEHRGTTRTGGRTRSFRRAFLLAYAGRVGERLREATRTAYRDAGGDTLPVLDAHEERVEAAFAEAVPHTVARTTTTSDPDGWRAGRAAADRARLDPHDRLEGR